MTANATPVPPHSIEAEHAVLGAILLYPRFLMIASVEEGLRPEDFYRERNALTYGAMLSLAERAAGIDVLTVCAELERTGKLEALALGNCLDQRAPHAPARSGNHQPHVGHKRLLRAL